MSVNPFKLLEEKYGAVETPVCPPNPPPKPPPAWAESPAVVALVEHLRQCKDLGGRVCFDGEYGLRFHPGLSNPKDSPEAAARWKQGLQAERLFFAALADIERLHRAGKLRLRP